MTFTRPSRKPTCTFLGFGVLLCAVLAGCAAVPSKPIELSIFSINDFHGHIQSQLPTPLSPRLPDPKTGEIKPQPAGGAAYMATVLDTLRASRPNSVFVAAGDLMGASPQMSALLNDEPTLSALGNMGLLASALGNHDLDAGLRELLRRTRGECPETGCAWPEFKGASFPYLAANMVDAQTGKRILPSHILRDIGGLKVAFVGAVTRDTPKVIVPRSIVGLRFEDEVSTLNALVPELRAAGAQVLVAIMHEGAVFRGAANDPTYLCEGLEGRGVDIAKALDPAYAVIISGHTHNAYTCKVNGRLLVQAGSFGGWLTESRLTLDATGRVLDSQAVNHPVLQSAYAPNPAFTALVQRASSLTEAIRNREIAVLPRGADRTVRGTFQDTELGNLIADAQLRFAQKRGAADIAFINSGGIRGDLAVVPGKAVTLNDLFAIQPFGNELVAMTLTGAQLRALLLRQLPAMDATRRFASASHTLQFQWGYGADSKPILIQVLVQGRPLDDARDYRIVVNNFMADGGDGYSVFKSGTNRETLGVDLDALVEYLREDPGAVNRIATGRIQRQ